MQKKLEEFHRRLGKVSGALSLMIVRRVLSREMVNAWADELESIAKGIRELVK